MSEAQTPTGTLHYEGVNDPKMSPAFLELVDKAREKHCAVLCAVYVDLEVLEKEKGVKINVLLSPAASTSPYPEQMCKAISEIFQSMSENYHNLKRPSQNSEMRKCRNPVMPK